MPRHYLDNAATSFPKPPAVYEAVRRAMVDLGASAGRGVYAEAITVEREILAARRALAELFGVDDPRRFAFFLNGTDALNQALFGSLKRGDRVVTSTLEHNSVLRPLARLREEQGVQVDYVAPEGDGTLCVDSLRTTLPKDATHLVVTAVSNVTGAVQPIDDIAGLAKERGLSLIVDAAQAAGHLPIQPGRWGKALVAFSGHKGLLGPLGTGVLWVSPEWDQPIVPLRLGGSGFRSEDELPPDELPQRLEAGNLNVPGILGLGAGVRYVLERGIATLAEEERSNRERIEAELLKLPAVRLFGSTASFGRIGVTSLALDGFSPEEAAAILDSQFGVQVRAGLHCAPRTHQGLGTANSGGTLRLSLGPFVTDEDLDAAIRAFYALAT
ncbi:MAG TPA: aminotransferase class V-fold PLP-dependent enzyme [Pirellulaceae bacterium]|jgi:cysteine desulfurase family protein|nr:aminotransferase class V-fold PLP-dependent enzyme [Pirellulaceae bacterium]